MPKYKNNEAILSSMSNLQPNWCWKIDLQKVDQHAGGKWLIHDTRRRKNNQLQSLKLACRILRLPLKDMIKLTNGYQQILKQITDGLHISGWLLYFVHNSYSNKLSSALLLSLTFRFSTFSSHSLHKIFPPPWKNLTWWFTGRNPLMSWIQMGYVWHVKSPTAIKCFWLPLMYCQV